MPSDTPPTPQSEETTPAEQGGRGERAPRPRYLVVALVVALLFGAGCWTEGYGRLAFYHGTHDEAEAMNASIQDPAERTRAEELYRRFTETSDLARRRAIPMAAATFVLGAALLALAARGLAGKTKARGMLVQVVIAQALVVGASYFTTRDVLEKELDWAFARTLIHQRQTMPPEQFREVEPMVASIRRFGVPGWLVIRTAASGLIVLALTRRRSRAFFDAAGDTVSSR